MTNPSAQQPAVALHDPLPYPPLPAHPPAHLPAHPPAYPPARARRSTSTY